MKELIAREVTDVMRAFRDLSGNLVVVGGVATMLYDYHEKASSTLIKTLYTRDIDVGVVDILAFKDEDIEKRFAEIGYTQELIPVSEAPKPITKYVKSVDDGEVEVEFLVPLVGSEHGRNGNPRIVKLIAPGMTAQQLRYFDILLASPYKVDLFDISNDDSDRRNFVAVPSPGYYLMHKFITMKRRHQQPKREKDAFYIFDILNRFEKNWDFLVLDVKKAISEFKRYREVKSFASDFLAHFREATSEGTILVMNEYNRSYSDKFSLTENQVVAFVKSFSRQLSV